MSRPTVRAVKDGTYTDQKVDRALEQKGSQSYVLKLLKDSAADALLMGQVRVTHLNQWNPNELGLRQTG